MSPDRNETRRSATDLLWMPSLRGGRFRPEEQLIVASAQDYLVRDVHGVDYLDLNSGLWHVSFGYSHPVAVAAAQRAVGELASTSMFRRLHEPALDLAGKLAVHLPGHRFFLGCTGSDAIDTTMRIASGYAETGGRSSDLFASVVGGYHGVTYAGMGVMGIESYRGAGRPAVPRVLLPAPESPDWAPALEKQFDEYGRLLAAVFVEVVQGSGGVIPVPVDYLRALRELCDRDGVLLVVDEVATGVHRTGPYLASSETGIRGDVTILGKAITGGFAPLSVVAVQERVFERVTRAKDSERLAGFTQGGHPVACSVAAALLDYVAEPEFGRESAASRAALAAAVEPLGAHPVVERITGRGHMFGVQVRPDVIARLGGIDAFVAAATAAGLRRRVLLHPLASGTVPFMPALICGPDVITEMTRGLDGVLDDLGEAAGSG